MTAHTCDYVVSEGWRSVPTLPYFDSTAGRRRRSLRVLLSQLQPRTPRKSVCQMERSTPIPQLGSEFNAFLFAPVGEDKNEMVLSVLSALARLNVDPWLEAVSLTKLSERAAIERLTSLIAALPNASLVCRNPAEVAARLIALLPRGAVSEIPCQTLLGADAALSSHVAVRLILINVIFVILMLGSLWLARTPTQPPGTSVTAPQAAPAQVSRPNFGR